MWFPGLAWLIETINLDIDIAVWVEIDGFGDSRGLYRFSMIEAYDLAPGEGSWQPFFPEGFYPRILSTQVDYIRGGFPSDSGSLAIRLADVDDRITEIFALDRPPIAVMAADASSLNSILEFVQTLESIGVSVGDMLWIGAEAVEVTALLPDTAVFVSRGRLNTRRQNIQAGAAVYGSPPWLRNRTMRLYLAPLRGPESIRQLTGEYVAEGIEWLNGNTAIRIDGRVRDAWFGRSVPGEPREIALEREPGNRIRWRQSLDSLRPWPPPPDPAVVPDEALAIFLVLSSVDKPDEFYDTNVLSRISRSLPGLKSDPDPDEGVYRLVLLGSRDFRYATAENPGSLDRTTNYIVSDHWVDILLCILLSAPTRRNSAPTNFDDTALGFAGRNYSGLPGGYGVGVRFDRIDWASFERARDANDLRLPNFVLGPERKPFREVVGPILEAVGAFMYVDGGQVRLILPEIPTTSEDVTVQVIEPFVLADRNDIPRLEVSRPADRLFSEIRFQVGETDVVSTWADFGRLFDPDDILDFEADRLEVEVPGAISTDQEQWARIAQRRLWATYRPPIIIRGDFRLSLWNWRIGENARVDLPSFANPRTGRRGLTGIAQLSQRSVVLSDEGIYLRLEMYLQPDVRIGRIAPAGDVLGVAGGGTQLSIASNLYTSSDAPDGLPRSDIEAFEIGDAVQLMLPSGVVLPTVRFVANISANVMTLNASFPGFQPLSTVIVARPADQVPRQAERYAAVGALPPWSYA